MTRPPTKKISFNKEDALENEDIAALAKAMEISLKAQKLGKGDKQELQDLVEAIKRSAEDVGIKQAKVNTVQMKFILLSFSISNIACLKHQIQKTPRINVIRRAKHSFIVKNSKNSWAFAESLW